MNTIKGTSVIGITLHRGDITEHLDPCLWNDRINDILIMLHLYLSVDKCKDCDENAHCYAGECVCKAGFTGNGYECVRSKIFIF